MHSPTSILVATDFGEAADRALTYGRTLARAFGASLHLLHVLENVFMRAVVADPLHVEAAALRRLDDRVTDADRRTLRARLTIKTSDHPAESIVSYARAAKIDLIVIGTHGRGGMERFLMGSVAERVVRTARCPVLTVRQADHEFAITEAPRATVETSRSMGCEHGGDHARCGDHDHTGPDRRSGGLG